MPWLVIPTTVHTNVLKYDGYASFVAALQENLHDGREAVEFLGVSAKDFDFLSSDHHKPLKSIKLSYNFLTGLLRVKMSGFSHETIAGLFRAMVDRQLFAMGVDDEFVPSSSFLAAQGNWA